MQHQTPLTITINRQIPNLGNLYPDVHSKHLNAFFGDYPNKEELGILRELCRDIKVVFLCFTNRCGSNFVAQSMASNGVISQPGENLNFDTVISHSRCNNFSSYVRYLIWLIELEAGSSRIFSVKCSAGQLIYLFNLGIIDQFNSPFFVMIKRLDMLKQAISLSIASQTHQWTSSQTSSTNNSITVNSDDIFRIVNNIANQNACFESIFSFTNVNPIRIVYEEFVKNPAKHISIIGDRICFSGLSYEPSNISYQKQSNEVNSRIYSSLIKELSI